MRAFLSRLILVAFAMLAPALAAEKKAIVIGAGGDNEQIQVGSWIGYQSMQASLGGTFWNAYTGIYPALTQTNIAKIIRLGDRFFLGAAVVNDGQRHTDPTNTCNGLCGTNDGAGGTISGSFTNLDWSGQNARARFNGGVGVGTDLDYATFAVLTDNHSMGWGPTAGGPSVAILAMTTTFGAQSNSTPRALECSIANVADSVNFPPVVPGWCFYAEAHRIGAGALNTYVLELEGRNSADAGNTSMTPNGGGPPTSTVIANIGCGAGLNATGQFYCSNVFDIHPNPLAFATGIIFEPGSICACGTGGTRPAFMINDFYTFEIWNGGGRSLYFYGDSGTLRVAGNVSASGIFYLGTHAGVNCPGGVTAGTVVVEGGIVTHC